MLSPSLPLGSISGLWGNQLLQYIEANTRSLDFHIFFHSGTTPLILLKLLSATHPTFSGALGPCNDWFPPLGASRLGLSHWAGPSVTRSAGWSQRWYRGIIVDILAKESKFP